MMERREFLRAVIAGGAGMIAIPRFGRWYRSPIDHTAYLQDLIDRRLAIPDGRYVVRRTLVVRNGSGLYAVGSQFRFVGLPDGAPGIRIDMGSSDRIRFHHNRLEMQGNEGAGLWFNGRTSHFSKASEK